MVLDHFPVRSKVTKEIYKFWPMLMWTEDGESLFKEPPILAYRRPRNIKDDLCSAKVSFPITSAGTSGKTHGNFHENCRRDSCIFCKMLKNKTSFLSTITHLMYHKAPPARMADCERKNLVYLIHCQSCQMQYVGETKRSFRTRIKKHLADVRHVRDTPVARHFNLPDHSHQHLKAEVIEVLTGDPDLEESTAERRRREYYWIHQLKTLPPFGMNSMG